MKVADRFNIIDKISRELQSRFSYREIDGYLAAFDISPPGNVGVNSKWVYAKAALNPVSLVVLARIVDDLDLGSIPELSAAANPPANWRGQTGFKLFISHISKDKDKATRLKACLSPFAIDGFVAHEDIQPTLEWQTEIERALFSMDALVAVHTVGFSQSLWTQQEIGFSLGRGIKVISFKMGEDPTGFISKRQALPHRRGHTAEDIAKQIDALLEADPLTAERLAEAKIASGVVIASDDELPF